jgi:uncharacterized Zn finger protein
MGKRAYQLHTSKSGTQKDSIAFLVQGSAPEPYEVLFRRRPDANLSAYCNCPAGENGMHCKHRIRILQGLVDGIVSKNLADVQEIVKWLPGTDVEENLRTVLTLEKEADRIKTALSAAKHALARCLLD